MQITFSGSVEFKRFGIEMNKAAKNLPGDLDRGLMHAGEDIGREIHSTSDNYMPSGYQELLASRLRTKVEKARTFRGVTVIIFAHGRSGRRDVERLNTGQLRHPVFGRVRELKAGGRYARKPQNIKAGKYINPWAVTKIRPGFVSVPVALEGPRHVRKRLEAALDANFKRVEMAT